MSPFSCSIVIRAFNEEKHIGRLLTGISQQSMNDFDVILVDSGSTDATIAIATAADWHFPVRITYIEPERFSFGRSLNHGINNSQGDIIVIASAHVYPVYPDWLEKMLSPFEDSKIALTYGKQRGNSSTRFSEHQIFAHWFPDQSQIRQTNPFCNNANAAIRRTLWEKHQYDEALSGLEDLEWARWAIEEGHSIAYQAEAEIIHIHEDTPRGIYNRYKREAMAFKRIFPQEQFNFLDFVRLFSSNAYSDVSHAFETRSMTKNIGSIIWFRFMQFWGTFKGYQQSGPLTRELRETFYYPTKPKPKSSTQPRRIQPINYNDIT